MSLLSILGELSVNKYIRSLIFLVMVTVDTTVMAAGCQVTSEGGMGFGTYDVSDFSPTDSTTTLTVTCDSSSPPTVTVEMGISATSGSIADREMRHLSLSDRMDYNLFIGPSMTAIWGDGTTGSSVTLSNINNNSPRQVMVYGSIPARQNVSVGTYTDNVTVTIAP